MGETHLLGGDPERQRRPVGGTQIDAQVIVDGHRADPGPVDVDAVSAALVHRDPLMTARLQNGMDTGVGSLGVGVDPDVGVGPTADGDVFAGTEAVHGRT